MRLPPLFADFSAKLISKTFPMLWTMSLEFQNDSRKLGFDFFGLWLALTRKKKVLCGYLEEVQVSCLFPTYLGILKGLHFTGISEIMKSPVIMVSTPMALFLYSAFTLTQRGKVQPVDHMKVYIFFYFATTFCTLSGIYQHENLIPRTPLYLNMLKDIYVHIFPNFNISYMPGTVHWVVN